MTNSEIRKGAKDAFFRAMGEGWISDGAETTDEQLPGQKKIVFEYGDYRVVDAYYSNSTSHKSSGQTTIWHKNQVIWVMTYEGHYDKNVLPFLKECLKQAYVTERRFYAGRGPGFVRGERFTYLNQIERASFSDFRGEEHIFDLEGKPCGYHHYRGTSLLK